MIWSDKDIEEFEGEATLNSSPNLGNTGFLENFGAMWDNEMASGLTISKRMMESDQIQADRELLSQASSNSEYDKFRTTPKTIEEQTSAYGDSAYTPMSDYSSPISKSQDYDMDGLRKAYSEKTGVKVKLQADWDEEYKQQVQTADQVYQKVSSRATFGGSVASFVAGAGAQLLEPVNYVTGFGAGVAMKSTQLGLSMVGRSTIGGASAMFAEVPIQLKVQSWKEENGLTYSDGNVVMSVLFAGALGAGIPAGLEAVGKAYRGVKGRIAENELKLASANKAQLKEGEIQSIKDQLEADEVLADKLKNMDYEGRALEKINKMMPKDQQKKTLQEIYKLRAETLERIESNTDKLETLSPVKEKEHEIEDMLNMGDDVVVGKAVNDAQARMKERDSIDPNVEQKPLTAKQQLKADNDKFIDDQNKAIKCMMGEPLTTAEKPRVRAKTASTPKPKAKAKAKPKAKANVLGKKVKGKKANPLTKELLKGSKK